MLASQVDPVYVTVVVGVVLALVTAYLALPPVRRARKLRLDEQLAGQAERTLALAREEQRIMEERWTRQLAEVESRCQRDLATRDNEIAKLTGRLEAMTTDWAKALAGAVIAAIKSNDI